MTWIVGMPTLWGYSIGISDIRVTLKDGSERDCLQKIYPVAQWITLGFAGSVFLGFTMVQAMRDWLRCDQPDRAWNPIETVELWPDIARHLFSAAPPQEQALGCALMMLSADPSTSTTGIGSKCYVHVFQSPQFAPVQIQTHKAGAIGSGAAVPELKKYLDDISNDQKQNFELMKMEAGMPGGMASILGFSLTAMLKKSSPSGISSHLHYCWQYLGKTVIRTNDHSTLGAWTSLQGGSGINQSEDATAQPIQKLQGGTHFEMPHIAQSWNDLVHLLQAAGASAEGSVT